MGMIWLLSPAAWVLWFIRGHESVVGVKLFLKPQASDGYKGKEQLGGWVFCRALPRNSGKGWEELGNGDILSRKARTVT